MENYTLPCIDKALRGSSLLLLCLGTRSNVLTKFVLGWQLEMGSLSLVMKTAKFFIQIPFFFALVSVISSNSKFHELQAMLKNYSIDQV